VDTNTRTQLIDDAFVLAQNGALNYTVALQMLDYLKTETHYAPWEMALRHLKAIDGRLTSADGAGDFRVALI
jgi:hypothetical protein